MCRARALLFVLLLTPLCALGQGYLYQTGNPTFSTQIPVENGFINVNNGDVHLEFPIAAPPQRGGILSSNARLVYDSRIWKIVNNNGNYSWQPTNSGPMGGWTILTGGETGKAITYAMDGAFTTNTGCPNNSGGYSFGQNTQTTWDNFVWTDPVGTSHTFNAYYIDNTTTCPIAPPGKSVTYGGWATDSSGLYISATGTTETGLGPQSFTIKDKNGTQVYPVIIDRNGNSLTLDSNGNTVDTVGRTPVLVTYNSNQIYLDVLTTAGPTARARYTITTEQVGYSTTFSESGVHEASGGFTAIQGIQLPDGSQYQFAYDSNATGASPSFGELTSMTLPTGGVINYGYGLFKDSFQNSNEWITSHTAAGGTTTFAPKTLSSCSSSQGCQESVTITSPDKNDTIYTFNLDKKQITNGGSWQSNVTAYQGQASGNVRLKAEATNYTYVTATAGNTYVGQQATVVTTTDTLSDVGVATQTATTLDPNFGSPVDMKIWNYQTPFSNAPDVDTAYTYQGTFLQQAVAQDGSNNQLSKMTSDLDGLGNVTGQHQWINTTGQTLDTSTTYGYYGMPSTSTTPEGTTTYGYDSSYHFLPISVTPPKPSSGAVLTTSSTYDFSTGVVTSTIDPNGKATYYKSFDAFNRPEEVDNPDGGITQVSYTPTSASASAANSSTGWTIQGYDAYGRLIRNNAATGVSSSPWYMQDTCYNPAGQVSFQSYRFQGQFSQAPVCSGAGDSYSYDALGRTTQIIHADGKSILSSYTGRATQVTDENGVSRITQTDAFGRVTAVCEISTDSTMPASGSPGPCGTDIPGTGFLTTYAYDLANHKTTVTQGAQIRIFQTDSIGRTILTQEPESGQTTWSYAYNSTGLLVTRQKPKANQANASVKTNTQTQYDALGRPISVTYDDGLTGNKLFSYDNAIAGATNVLGRLAEQYAAASSAGPAIEIFGYDAMGRTNQVVTCLPSTCGTAAATQNYTYDYAGNMLSATDGVGALTNYTYTPASELTSITSPQSAGYPVTLVSNVTNGPNGPVSYRLGNGLNQVYGYDGMGRRTGGWLCSGSSSAACTGGTQVYGATIGVNGGRINQACDTVLGTCGTMTYDSFNRLTSRTATSGNTQNGSWTYDRYGNRWSQTVSPGGYQQQISFNTANNQASGFQYDVAGNLINDTAHTYTYDAEGNMVAVDGGSTAKYGYDASNHRVRFDIWGGAFEELYNLTGQKVVIWNAGSESVVEEDTHLGTQPLAVYLSGSLFFEHQDWLGTERVLTDGAGNTAGSYLSLPFGDGFTDQGTDLDPYHFAGLDHDYESGLDHGQFREYSSAGGRWLSPDPYSGSYDWSNPQSLNRYAYALNNPLSFVDTSGLITLAPSGGGSSDCSSCSLIGQIIVQAFEAIFKGLFGGPSFHGSLANRPTTFGSVSQADNGTVYVNIAEISAFPPFRLPSVSSILSGSAPSNGFTRMPLPANHLNCSSLGTSYVAPPSFSLSTIVAAGQAAGRNPFALRSAVGQGGTFDFQRVTSSAGNIQFYGAYTPVSNFAVGAYEFGAGFTRTQGDFLSNGYAALFSSNAGDPKQALYRHLGYDAASKGDASCSQSW